MRLPLRHRIVLTLLPLLALIAILGGSAVLLLHQLGSRIDKILHENFDSVLFMQRLNEALERIDSSFQFALAGREDKARQQYADNWKSYRVSLRDEQGNITLPGERELVEELIKLTEDYRDKGNKFYELPARSPQRQDAYFGRDGLLDTFQRIKEVSQRILLLNQDDMVDCSRQARSTAWQSMFWFAAGFVAAVLVAGLLAWHVLRAILRPIRAVTKSALAIGRGELHQVVPILSHDELGDLADAFNTMARQLRHYRQTDYARLLRAQGTSQATIDSFPDPVLVVDGEGRVEMANPAAHLLFGVAPEGVGKPSPLIWQPPEPLRPPLTAALREQRSYLPQGFDRAISLHVDGAERVFLPRILPIRDPYGGTIGAAVLLQDVTRFRLLDQVKSDLLATVSHELKTPLTSIRLAVHLILEEAVGPLTPKQTELLLDARDNAERLLARINSLLDLARLEQKRDLLDLRPEAPGTLLETAAEAIRPRAADKGVEVIVDVPPDLPPVVVDAARLRLALDNLLDNAVTYTERGGRITLSAAASDGQVTLSVADTGCGIPAEHVPHVFDKFFRVPEQSVPGGSGLGLAIAQEVVNVHGGSITCESSPGVGTVFRVSLPAEQESNVHWAPRDSRLAGGHV
jgi:NtrC-family two-component system sensor histidine kinase KinB